MPIWTDIVHAVEGIPKAVEKIPKEVVTGVKGIPSALTHLSTSLTSGGKGIIPDVTATKPSPTGWTTTKTTKKAKTTTKQSANEQEYINQILSMLQPFQTAIGELPGQYKTIVGKIQSIPDYTATQSDTIMKQLAEQYSPSITAGSNQPAALTASEQRLTNVLKTEQSPTGSYEKALTTFAKIMPEYASALPYKALTTALLNRIKYTITYQGQVPPVIASAPTWLKSLLSGATGESVTATGNIQTNKTPTVPGLTSQPSKTSATAAKYATQASPGNTSTTP